MIYAICGKQGIDKTYYLTLLCRKFLNQGINVYANYKIDQRIFKFSQKKIEKGKIGKLYYWNDVAQFRHIFNGIVLIDEIGAYFESRNFSKFTTEDRIKFQQHRKERLDIYYTVQAYTRTDLIIRQLTNQVIQLKKFFNIFTAWEYDATDYEFAKDFRTIKCLSRNFYFLRKKIYQAYDTYALINASERNFMFKNMAEFFKDVDEKLNSVAVQKLCKNSFAFKNYFAKLTSSKTKGGENYD